MPQCPIPAELVALLADTHHVMVLTGAGVSAESGVPTFRDAQTGLWERFRAEDLATAEAFRNDPYTVWSWYEWRRDLVGRVAPNAGHVALAALAVQVPRLTLVTQNVDGLHRRAGSDDLIEFHGNLFENHCLDCGLPAPDVARPCPAPPRCAACGEFVRPGVVWFGEAIPAGLLPRALDAADDCGVFLSVGTSAMVQPAAGLAQRAMQSGATLVEVNPQPTELSELADYVLRANSGVALPALVAALRARRDAGAV